MEMETKQVFSERFRLLRAITVDPETGKSMPQAKFATFLGISRPTVGFYENGDRLPDADVLRRICEKCNVTSDWLLGLSEFETRKSKDEANELQHHLSQLMSTAFDEGDRRRIKNILLDFVCGFEKAIMELESYDKYQQASETIIIVMSKVVECLTLSNHVRELNIVQSERDELFKELYDVIKNASAQAYTVLGTFFDANLKCVRKSLDCNTCFGTDYSFAHKLEALKSQWGD